MILVTIVLSSSLVAALWGWRLEAVKTDRLKCDAEMERTKSAKWAELYGRKCEELAELSRQHSHDVMILKDTDEQNKKALEHLNVLASKNEALQNEIDGLNIDKFALKERLQKYEAAEEKRREQKRIGMQRYRANKKKGVKK